MFGCSPAGVELSTCYSAEGIALKIKIGENQASTELRGMHPQ